MRRDVLQLCAIVAQNRLFYLFWSSSVTLIVTHRDLLLLLFLSFYLCISFSSSFSSSYFSSSSSSSPGIKQTECSNVQDVLTGLWFDCISFILITLQIILSDTDYGDELQQQLMKKEAAAEKWDKNTTIILQHTGENLL